MNTGGWGVIVGVVPLSCLARVSSGVKWGVERVGGDVTLERGSDITSQHIDSERLSYCVYML